MWACRGVRPCCGRRGTAEDDNEDTGVVWHEDSHDTGAFPSKANSKKELDCGKAASVETHTLEEKILERLPSKPRFPPMAAELSLQLGRRVEGEEEFNIHKVHRSESSGSAETDASSALNCAQGDERVGAVPPRLAEKKERLSSRKQPKQKPPRYRRVLSGGDASLPSASLKIDIHNPGEVDTFYELGRKLGEGSFGSVVEGSVKSTGAQRAIKSIQKARFQKKFKLLRREISIGKMVDHPNIIKLYEIFEDRSCVHLVMELCAGGELSDRIPEKGMSEAEAAGCLVQILRGVNYMHKHGICHRDLKAQNVLVTGRPFSKRRESIFAPPDHAPSPGGGASPRVSARRRRDSVNQNNNTLENRLRITDFGVSCGFTPGSVMTERAGTPTHMAPEVFQKRYTQACDIWSVGVILYQLLSSRLPFDGATEEAVRNKILRYQYVFGGAFLDASNEVVELLQGMLREASQRLTAEAALKHIWFSRALPGREVREIAEEVIENLRGYSKLNRLKKASLNVIASLLTEEQICVARQAFMDIDVDGDGYVSTAELRETMLAMKVKKHKVEAAVSDIFGNKKESEVQHRENVELKKELNELRRRSSFKEDLTLAKFTYTEFLAATFDREKHLTEEVCMAAFECFDKDGSGKLSADELVSGKLLGKLEEDEIRALMQDFDADGDVEIDRYEFMEVMRSGEGWTKCFRSRNRIQE